MMAYEMVGISDHNSRTYESKYGTYNKETGFVLNEVGRSLGKCELLDRMFHENCWSMKTEPKPKKMTKEEIEKELGYEIEIKEPEEKKLEDNQNISKNAQKTKNNVFSDDIFDFLFWRGSESLDL